MHVLRVLLHRLHQLVVTPFGDRFPAVAGHLLGRHGFSSVHSGFPARKPKTNRRCWDQQNAHRSARYQELELQFGSKYASHMWGRMTGYFSNVTDVEMGRIA